MEDTLGEFVIRFDDSMLLAVLILVLMEDTLGDCTNFETPRVTQSLNPCFNGRYSRRV